MADFGREESGDYPVSIEVRGGLGEWISKGALL